MQTTILTLTMKGPFLAVTGSLSPHNTSWVQTNCLAGSSLCMFSKCMHGFFLGSSLSSPSRDKHVRLTGDSKLVRSLTVKANGCLTP